MESKYKKINNYAFTIIELLIVFAIIGILFGIGVAYYQGFNRRQVLVQTAKTLKNDLRSIQNSALTGQKDCRANIDNGCGGLDNDCGDADSTERPLTGWRITFNNNSYRYEGVCAPAIFSQKTITLPTGISFTTPPAGQTYTFFPLAATSANLDICLTDGTNFYGINITSGGEIKDRNEITTGSCN